MKSFLLSTQKKEQKVFDFYHFTAWTREANVFINEKVHNGETLVSVYEKNVCEAGKIFSVPETLVNVRARCSKKV